MKQYNNQVLQEAVSRLNAQQQQAVELPEVSSLILSTAGSGKTSTLTARIAYIVSELGVPSSQVLAVTFTNKAASEMRSRLKNFALSQMPSWIGTFHSVCNRILRSHCTKVGLTADFYIIDAAESQSMVKRIIKNNYSSDIDYEPILDQINSWQEAGLRAKDAPKPGIALEVFKLYESECVKNNCVDFAQLMSRVHEIFITHESVRVYYARQWRFILVDEFQDTNDLQYKLLSLLANPQSSLGASDGLRDDSFDAPARNTNAVFACGDDDQCLYSWRGARVGNMDDFLRDYNPVVVKLEKNYRSDGFILQAANSVIHNNTQRQAKQLVATKDAIEKIRYHRAANELAEAGFIAEQIMNFRRQGMRFNQMCVLYRTNSQSRAIEKVFAAQNIEHMIYGGFKFFDRVEIKNAIAYLRLAINKNDNLAYSRVYNTPARSLGSVSFEKLQAIALKESVSLSQAVGKMEKKVQEKFQVFEERIEELADFFTQSAGAAKRVSLASLMQHIIVNSGLENMYKNDKKEGPQKLDNLYELISAAKVFEKENPGQDLKTSAMEFLALCSLESDPESKKEKAQTTDCVKLMTIHTAKGLEWDVVFIAGCEEGLLPHGSNSSQDDLLAEERRLMYVAMTRARKILYITRASERMFAGNINMSEPSRFLFEIPKGLLVTKY